MKPAFDHADYSTILFMDSMVALEAKPLPTLPWKEIDPDGPILILVVPQVSTEIDKRKRDGRLSKRAREFNRLISPAAESGQPARIAKGPPAVDIAVARTERIDWNQLDDLDPEEPDARVVAQILHARDVPSGRKLLLSHDTNPIAMASRHGLKCSKLREAWLLGPEPSPKEKELARLKARVKELESTQPNFSWILTFGAAPPVRVFRIEKLSNDQRKLLSSLILSENPPHTQHLSGLPAFGRSVNYDHDYDDNYEKFQRSVARYTDVVNRLFETHYGQIPFSFEITNNGELQAENLILSLRATGGTLHDRFTCYPLFGPIAPQPRSLHIASHLSYRQFSAPPVGRHEIDFAIGPDRGDKIEIHCADFRHGRSWTFNGIATIDPRAEDSFMIEISITAANMRGRIEEQYKLAHEVEDVKLNALINLNTKTYHIPFPMAGLFEAETKANRKNVDFVNLDGALDEDFEDEDEC